MTETSIRSGSGGRAELGCNPGREQPGRKGSGAQDDPLRAIPCLHGAHKPPTKGRGSGTRIVSLQEIHDLRLPSRGVDDIGAAGVPKHNPFHIRHHFVCLGIAGGLRFEVGASQAFQRGHKTAYTLLIGQRIHSPSHLTLTLTLIGQRIHSP